MKTNKTLNPEVLTAWIFVLPTVLLLAIYNVYPIIYSFILSLSEWSGSIGTDPVFVGVQNYIEIFDPNNVVGKMFVKAFFNTMLWTVLFSTIPVFLGMMIALLLNIDNKLVSTYKIFFYMPMVLSFVVLGLVWKWVFLQDGLLNVFLGALFGIEPINWLGDPNLALFSVVTAAGWRHVAYCMIIYLAGLKSVPMDLLEAAKIDGANKFQQYIRIIIPLLKPSTTVVMTTTLVSSFTAFDIVFAMTRGGPNGASDVIGSRMYQEAFWNLRLGEASAMSYVMFIVVAAVTIPYCIKQIKQTEEML